MAKKSKIVREQNLLKKFKNILLLGRIKKNY